MKKKILLVILVFLIFLICSISYLKYFYDKSNGINHYVSYHLEKYDKNDKLLLKDINEGFSLDIDSNHYKINFCFLDVDECFAFSYKKNGSQYINISSETLFFDADFELEDSIDSVYGDIVIWKFIYHDYDDEKMIIYFKKDNN